jgi:hypothetical protein
MSSREVGDPLGWLTRDPVFWECLKFRANLSGGSLQPGKAFELHAGFVWSSSRQDGFHAYASPEAGSDFKHFYSRQVSAQAVHAD